MLNAVRKSILILVAVGLFLFIYGLAWPAVATGPQQNATPKPSPTRAFNLPGAGIALTAIAGEEASGEESPGGQNDNSGAGGGQIPIEEPASAENEPTATPRPARSTSDGSSRPPVRPNGNGRSGGGACSAPVLSLFLFGVVGLFGRRSLRRRRTVD